MSVTLFVTPRVRDTMTELESQLQVFKQTNKSMELSNMTKATKKAQKSEFEGVWKDCANCKARYLTSHDCKNTQPGQPAKPPSKAGQNRRAGRPTQDPSGFPKRYLDGGASPTVTLQVSSQTYAALRALAQREKTTLSAAAHLAATNEAADALGMPPGIPTTEVAARCASFIGAPGSKKARPVKKRAPKSTPKTPKGPTTTEESPLGETGDWAAELVA